MSEIEIYEGPAIVELMGHRRLAGYVSEAEMFGAKLLRVDVPGGAPDGSMATQFYGGGAIYCITPTSEEIVQRIAGSATNQVRPVERWELAAPEDERPEPSGEFDEEPFDSEDREWD